MIPKTLDCRLSPEEKTSGYIIGKGDNLTKLAKLYGTTPVTIAKLNNIKLDGILKIGQQVVIPSPNGRPNRTFLRGGGSYKEALDFSYKPTTPENNYKALLNHHQVDDSMIENFKRGASIQF